MSRPTQINVKELRWIKQKVIRETSRDGVKLNRYNEIYGMLLIPVADAPKFGIAPSTLRRYFDKGILTKYNANGTPKRTKRKTPTYFDLYAWRDLNLEEV